MAKSEKELTDREKEILQLIYEGLTDGNISRKLNISVNTVRTHRQNLRAKLDAANTTSMLHIASKKKLLQR